MCFSILIFSSAGLSLHTLNPLLFAYMQSNQGWTKCCAIPNFMFRTTDMQYATSSTANFFFPFFLHCLVGANWGMRESALAHLPWLPSFFFKSFKNSDFTLHAVQSHSCELCVKKWREASDTLVQVFTRYP